VAAGGDHHLDDVLDLLDRGNMVLRLALHRVDDELRDLADVGEVGKAKPETVRGVVVGSMGGIAVPGRIEGERDGAGNALGVPRGTAAVALDDFGERADTDRVIAAEGGANTVFMGLKGARGDGRGHQGLQGLASRCTPPEDIARRFSLVTPWSPTSRLPA